MFLAELFDKTLPWEWVQSPKPIVVKSARFDTPNGQQFTVDFIAKREPNTPRDLINFKKAEVEFYTLKKGRGMGSVDITGKGESLLVFATVLEITKEFMSTFPKAEITFSAAEDEPTRIKLYDRLIKRFAPNAKSSSGYVGTEYTIPAIE